MTLRGDHFLAGAPEAGAGPSFTAMDPHGGAALSPAYREASPAQVDRAAAAAGAAAVAFAVTPPTVRARLLRAIADGLLGLGDELLARVTAETALPPQRVQSERGRTVLQLQQFAALLEEGSWVDARIDHADRQRQPQPKPDVRSMRVPLGPVAVFGASNFPLAYSVAGGDTASALAAGCPVVVKGHPAHPGTSELVGSVVAAAVRGCALPDGVFSLLHGREHALGERLVEHPAIAAVGFTGSHAGGRALLDRAARRQRPIPVFAEMGSMNPVVVLPQALAHRGAGIAEQVAASALLAQGQFCTSPGLVCWIDGPGGDAFAAALRERVVASQGGPAVHPSIRAGFESAVAEVAVLPAVVAARAGGAGAAATAVCPTLFTADVAAVLKHPRLRREIYGPAVLAVRCADAKELRAVLAALEGHLTGTVHEAGDDLAAHADVVALLQQRVGRLIANGVPTGVEVCGAMVHGGPYPASTDARYSAVGVTSIARWTRPQCWQDWPAAALPPELRDDNPLGIARIVDGVRC
ncbi:MAG: aldehyde dehydrogenase (NADP(+)) [Phycisphaerales bacterium]|nr:aldehyde dehydrogenase (NADP(+)) [Phycisphaerales bacterium]